MVDVAFVVVVGFPCGDDGGGGGVGIGGVDGNTIKGRAQ